MIMLEKQNFACQASSWQYKKHIPISIILYIQKILLEKSWYWYFLNDFSTL